MLALKTLLAAAAAAIVLPLAAMAQDGLHLRDPFARVTPRAGAVYLYIENLAGVDDRLISASSDVAAMVMPMTMVAGADGKMAMIDVPEGFDIPAGSSFVLAPGHEHLMLMGLKTKLKTGDMLTMTLVFANSGEITITVPVDAERKEAPANIETPYSADTINVEGGAAGAEAPMGNMENMDMDKMDMGASGETADQ